MRRKPISLFVLALGISGFVSALGAEQPEAANGPVRFVDDVMPLVNKLGCNLAECHGSSQGKGGLKLSMFGAEPAFDYAALTKAAQGRRINKVEPLKSLFLLKATGSVEHKGGKKFEVSPGEKVLSKGEAQQLSVTAVFSDESRKDVTGLAAYTSTAASVAGVDANGNVQAADFGQAYVVAGYMRRFANARIVVP